MQKSVAKIINIKNWRAKKDIVDKVKITDICKNTVLLNLLFTDISKIMVFNYLPATNL